MSSPRTAQTPGWAAARRPSDAPEFERDYLTMMVDHHFMATEMAKVCQAGGVRTELRDKARDMETAQLAEIRQLQDWLRDWHRTDKKPEMSADGREMLDKLKDTSGDALEMEFLTMMVEHHGVAIKKSKDATDKVEHDEVRAFSRTLVAEQSDERDQLRRWLKEWHGQA
jgi:uncharacterized protein (DUF305 family)